jgi:hypothetical protein
MDKDKVYFCKKGEMKRVSLLLLAVLSGCVTGRQGELRTGDLIFVSQAEGRAAVESSMDGAIAAATGDIIHVAVVEVDDGGSVWVIDATSRRGVDRRPLETFLRDFSYDDGTPPVYTVKRMNDPGLADKWIKKAKSFCGQPYDQYFLPDNGAMYCSELVRESFLDENGDFLFVESPMNFKNADGEFPAYWTGLFARLGTDIPQGVPGTNPQDMSASPLLHTVSVSLP